MPSLTYISGGNAYGFMAIALAYFICFAEYCTVYGARCRCVLAPSFNQSFSFMHPFILKYYPEDTPLRRLLLHHSEQVANRALQICDRHPELGLNRDFLREAALIHDIGIFLTDAPGIHCHGTSPYLTHGVQGAALMRKEGREDLARICERHTGTGLTAENIRQQGLPLPESDLLPETLEEQVVCYADKFYSKSHPERERTVEQTAKSLEKFGAEGVKKFLTWAELFE